jgi:hypothetical protein
MDTLEFFKSLFKVPYSEVANRRRPGNDSWVYFASSPNGRTYTHFMQQITAVWRNQEFALPLGVQTLGHNRFLP